jgi:hypothetical protein
MFGYCLFSVSSLLALLYDVPNSSLATNESYVNINATSKELVFNYCMLFTCAPSHASLSLLSR